MDLLGFEFFLFGLFGFGAEIWFGAFQVCWGLFLFGGLLGVFCVCVLGFVFLVMKN